MSIGFVFVLKRACVRGDASEMQNVKTNRLKCEGGMLLTSSVCLPNGYLKGEAPESPTIIDTKMEINNIREINDKKMTITLDYYQELKWTDNRIIASSSVAVLNTNLIDHVWKPDLWIKNICNFKLHRVLEPTSGLIIISDDYCDSNNCTGDHIKRNTTVMYNHEAQATIYCNFDFLYYPMDTQHCDFIMDGSYPYPNIVNIIFKEGQFGVTNNNTNTDAFIIDVTFKDVQGGTNGTGIHSSITMKRCLLPFLIEYYLPCIAIIVVSFVSFLISLRSLPARVALLVTEFLTLTNILIAQQVNIEG